MDKKNMRIDIKAPSPGESITEVEISKWLVSSGAYVKENQPIAEIETDKTTLEIYAEQSGKITIEKKENTLIKVEEIIGFIDTSIKKEEKKEQQQDKSKEEQNELLSNQKDILDSSLQEKSSDKKETYQHKGSLNYYTKSIPSASTLKLLKKEKENHHIEEKKASQWEKEKEKKEVLDEKEEIFPNLSFDPINPITQVPLSSLRKKVAHNLVLSKNKTAMLTTFNEVDTKALLAIRKLYKKEFKESHNTKIGLMSFFIKATVRALELFPDIYARIDEKGAYIERFKYMDIGIAMASPKGLMVPVIRDIQSFSLLDIEKEIKRLKQKVLENKISLEELSGGNFTISNGGIFGSMLSTPIINYPQSAILGMHRIIERPVAIKRKVKIRPMMYLALSYDHRLIDGKEAVGFLKAIKEAIEDPVCLL